MMSVQKPFFGRLCYGYIKNSDGQVFIDKQQAQTVSLVFEQYLKGDSLAKIVEVLRGKDIPSPTGNSQWTRAAIDKLLSSIKYVPHIMFTLL